MTEPTPNNEVISNLEIMLAAARLYRVTPHDTEFELNREHVTAPTLDGNSHHLLTGKETYTLRFTVDTHQNPGVGG